MTKVFLKDHVEEKNRTAITNSTRTNASTERMRNCNDSCRSLLEVILVIGQ